MGRDLLAGGKTVVGGWVATFDDLFATLAHGNGDHRPVLTDAQRGLLLRRIARGASRFAGFADTLGATIAELESGLVEPDDLDADLAELLRTYRAELDRLGRWDRDRERRYAAERVANELDAWDGRPVYAYGFEDLTAAQWALVEALSGRADVTVSLPYEPGRLAFSVLERTAATLSRQAAGKIEELPAASHTLHDLRSPTSSAGCSRMLPLSRRPWRARCASSRDPGPAGRWSSWATRFSSSCVAGRILPRSPSSRRRWSAGAGRSRRRSPGSASHTRSRAGCAWARRRSAARCCRCSASPGWAATVTTSTPSCARRTPGSAATTSTSSRGGCAGARSGRPSASRKRR